MKIALLLLPETSDTVDRLGYTAECKRRVQAEGYVLLQPAELTCEVIEKIEPTVDAFFLFTDFGANTLMCFIAKEYPEKVIDRNFSEGELQEYMVNTLESILAYVASKEGFKDIALVKAKTRKREIVAVRQYYFKRAKEVTRKSLLQIGSLVGKDHATVLHGIHTVDTVREMTQRYNELFHGAPHIERKNVKMKVKRNPETKRTIKIPVKQEYQRPPAVYSNQRADFRPLEGAYLGYKHF